MAVILTALKKPGIANERGAESAPTFTECLLKITHTSGDTYATSGQALTKAAIAASLGVSAFNSLANFRGLAFGTAAGVEASCFYDEGNEKIILNSNDSEVSNSASLTSRVDYLTCTFSGA